MQRNIFEDEHEQFRAAVNQFLTREVVDRNGEFERAGIVDRDVFVAAGASGFLGFAIPTEHGGGGVRDFRYNAVLGEETRGSASAASVSGSRSTPTSASRTSSTSPLRSRRADGCQASHRASSSPPWR